VHGAHPENVGIDISDAEADHVVMAMPLERLSYRTCKDSDASCSRSGGHADAVLVDTLQPLIFELDGVHRHFMKSGEVPRYLVDQSLNAAPAVAPGEDQGDVHALYSLGVDSQGLNR
jgi:hypothetical protein